MPIPQSQLETWSAFQQPQLAQNAHQSIRSAFRNIGTLLGGDKFVLPAGPEVDIYLQGSYKNSTNIRADSDVDIVIELKEIKDFDVSKLGPFDLALFNRDCQWVSYGYQDFKAAILDCLLKKFSSEKIQLGNKSIKRERNQGE